MLDKGINIKKLGQLAVLKEANSQSNEAIIMLIKAGVEVNNSPGLRALEIAIESKNKKLYRELSNAGAIINEFATKIFIYFKCMVSFFQKSYINFSINYYFF